MIVVLQKQFLMYVPNGYSIKQSTYWLEIEVFENARFQIDMLYDFFQREWMCSNVWSQTIAILKKARPRIDWSELEAKGIEQLKNKIALW